MYDLAFDANLDTKRSVFFETFFSGWSSKFVKFFLKQQSLIDNSKQSILIFFCFVGFWPLRLSCFITVQIVKFDMLNLSIRPVETQVWTYFILLLQCCFAGTAAFNWKFQRIKFDLYLCCRVLTTLRLSWFITVQIVKFGTCQ